jgi:uncharacterized membrane protein YeaQ/YmgE (transglycosylase-associated protein family)
VQILGTLFSGFVVGLIARALMPGDQKMGFIRTTGLGILGAFAGGILSNLASGKSWNASSQLSTVGLGASVVGALCVMVLARLVRGK